MGASENGCQDCVFKSKEGMASGADVDFQCAGSGCGDGDPATGFCDIGRRGEAVGSGGIGEGFFLR